MDQINDQKKLSREEKKVSRRQHTQLLLGFLKGSKHLFAGSIIASLIYALCDMLDPQIFRAAIDNAIGGKEPAFPQFVMDFVDRLGGFSYLGQHLWIMALAVVCVAVVRGISGYLLAVNPFNQPGVEAYKKNMFALLGKPGYEDQKAELEARLNG